VLGVQFVELFKENLYFDLAKHANALATRLAQGIKDQGYAFLTESSTNQIFPIFPNTVIEKLQSRYGFYVWSKIDDNTSSIRLVTSWATTEEAAQSFLDDLQSLANS
jgi:threonine aldolase